MVSPFKIEEIFPDDERGSVKMPRRQAGSSPQSLAVTLLADYTAYTRSWIPSAAIVALLGEAGVSTAGARAAISRLARRHVVESMRQGRLSFYRLTQVTADDLMHGGRWIATFGSEVEPWDGWWTLIAFSMPQEAAAERRALREQLRWRGYAPLYDGLWVSPYELDRMSQLELYKLTNGALTVFRARHVDVDAVTSRAPIEAWDTEALARQYEAFIARWRHRIPQVQTGAITGAEAVRARTEVMDTYRRFPVLDPRLPVELMPEGWPRQEARAVFAAVYDGLATAAEEHVRAVVERYAPGASEGVRAHTTVDLLTSGSHRCTP